MIKLNYEFKAKSPLHTGADTDMGTLKSLRRQKVILAEQKEVETKYTFEQQLEAIADILYQIWKKIDKDKIKGKRLMGIWGEFHSKILQAASTQSRFDFLQRICQLWDIENLDEVKILEYLDNLNDYEFLDTIRSKSHYLVLKVRLLRENKGKIKKTLFDTDKNKTPNKSVKTYALVPMISGNSIRGLMRRLVMSDFVAKTGIEKIWKEIYHMLFTGGVLDSSTMYEDIAKRENMIKMCPMIGLFGSAIGNMTVQGSLGVGHAYPKCSEMGTSDISYWNYIEVFFQTRLDDTGLQKAVDIHDIDSYTIQMKYEYEIFAKGTPFSHSFQLFEDRDELLKDCFYYALKLLKENNYITGMRAIGNAEIDLSELSIPKNTGKKYLKYLEDNKEEIRKFWEDRS